MWGGKRGRMLSKIWIICFLKRKLTSKYVHLVYWITLNYYMQHKKARNTGLETELVKRHPPVPSEEQRSGTSRPCCSLFLYLHQSGFNRQLSYILQCHAKEVWEQFIYRKLDLCGHVDICRWICDMNWQRVRMLLCFLKAVPWFIFQLLLLLYS